MIKSYILWLGSIYDVEQAATSAAMAPAAGRWQTSLLNAVVELGVPVRAVGHSPQQMWPRGRKLFVHGGLGSAPVPYSHVAYLNAPFVRARNLERQYLRGVQSIVAEHGPPRAVLSYNMLPWMRASVRWLRKQQAGPWLPVVLDFSTRYGADPAAAILQCGADATGFVFLSHWAASLPLGKPALHLDSGVEAIWDYQRPQEDGELPMVLYTGMLIPAGGADGLAKAVLARQTRPVRLVLTGRGPSAALQEMIVTDTRIRYDGLVPEARLNELMRSAAVLANPRPHDIAGNEWNFPSKLLHYLSTLRPVASTITPGVAPEYRDHVAVMEGSTPEQINAAIDTCLNLSIENDRQRAQRTAAFLAANKTWQQQASRLMEFVEHVCRTATHSHSTVMF